MAIKWIYGNFATGAINENNELPVAGNNDKSTKDVNAGDNSTISMAKRALGDNWTSIISEGLTLAAEVDTEAAWNSPNAVRTGGWVNKVDGRINDLITAQIVGYREYLAARICSPLGTGGTTKPKDAVKFEAGTWQGLMAQIILDSFKPVQGAAEQPPTNLGTVFADTSGTGIQRATKLADAEYYSAILDDIRDNLSTNGNEYRFVLRWADDTKQKMVWDVYIGNDTDGKLGWAGTNTNIVLNAEQFAHLDFKLSLSSEKIANRVIAQSKAGDETTNTGSDYTVVSESNGKPLFDTFWNPGQELTAQMLLDGATARVKDLKSSKGTASYEVKGEYADWAQKLGSQISFIGGTDVDTSGYDIVVRCTGINWSASDKKLTVDIMLPQSRYPRLPSSKSKSDNPMFGGDFAGGGSRLPVSGGYTGGNYTPNPGSIKFDDLTPVYVAPPIDKNETSKIACGTEYSSAIAADGSLYSWGWNGNGRLGTGNTTDSLNPIKIGTDTTWVGIYTNGGTSYALKRDNTLWGWGSGTSGQIADGRGQDVLSPIKIADNVKSVWGKMNNQGVHIIKNDGTLWGCGYNSQGQLGVGHTVLNGIFEQVTTKTDWVKVESNAQGHNSGEYTMFALDAAGVVWKWGDGNPTPAPISSPMTFTDFTVSYIDYQAVQHQRHYIGAKGSDGKLYTWGTGYHDESGTATYRATPALYGGSISDFYGFAYCHTFDSRPIGLIMVIKNDGTLWCFGSGGNYGDNSIVGSCATPLEYGHNTYYDFRKPHFMRTTTGDWFAILGDGKLWAGGQNGYGELGRGDAIATRPLIYQIGTSTNWIRLHVEQSYYAHSIGVITDSMYGTGRNGSGQLGTGDTTNKTSWTIQPTSSGI